MDDRSETKEIAKQLHTSKASFSPLSAETAQVRNKSHLARKSLRSSSNVYSDMEISALLRETSFSSNQKDFLSQIRATNPLADSAINEDLDSLALINATGERPSLRFDSSNNILSITGQFFLQSQDGTDASKIAGVVTLLEDHKSLIGFGSNEVARVNAEILKNDRGESIFKIDRVYKDLPVWGRQLVVTEQNGSVTAIFGKFKKLPDNINISTQLNDSQLNDLVNSEFIDFDPSQIVIKNAARGIYIKSKIPIYAYQVIVEASLGRQWELYFNPNSKRLIAKTPLFYEASTPSTGIDLLDATRSFNSYFQNDEYILYDLSFPESQSSAVADANLVDGLYPWKSSTDPNSGWDAAAVSAISNSKETYDYFLNTHSRNSFDGNGTELRSFVNATDDNGDPFFGAYWTSSSLMFYGTGKDGSRNLAVALDVAGHEFSHGVVQFTANLRYQNQSGALNESFADFFGAMIDRDDWYMGEDLLYPYGPYDYLRDMSNPASTGHPGHMDNFLNLPNTKEGDYGGVHLNSGIQNRALYLIADGLTDERRGVSIGKSKTERLAYSTLLKLSADAEFIDSANTMILEAENIYGQDSAEHQAVITAWDTVGVTTSVVINEGGTEDISLSSGDDVLVHLYPRDGSIDNLWQEDYDIYVQLVNQPFSAHISSAEIGPINDFPAAGSQPTLHTDERGYLFAAYVGTDGKARWTYVSDTNEDTEILDSDGIQSVATTPSGDLFAVVFSGSNSIYVYSFAEESWETIQVVGPSYSVDEEGENVNLVDAINFDQTGQKILFDFEICKAVPDETECQSLWSIGMYDLGTKNFEYPFSSSDINVDLGFPRFANTRNDIIAFDYQNWTEYEADGKAVSRSIIYDLASREVIGVYETNGGETRVSSFGIPTFVGDDDALVLQSQNDTSTQLYQISLDDTYSYITNSFIWVTPFESAFGEAHRNAYKNIVARLDSDKSNSDIGAHPIGSTVKTDFTLSNTGNRELAITAISLTNSNMLGTNLTNRILLPDESVTFSLEVDTSFADLGLFSGTMIIEHSGDNPTLNLGVSGYIDTDTDEDGILNSEDDDDDGDGVLDVDDAFPYDSTEWLDTDSDGIGNNADSDDDGDGLSDAYETQIGTNSLLADTDGDGVDDGLDAFPLDASETSDVDQDGVGDNQDSDDNVQIISGSLSAKEIDVGQTTQLTVNYRVSDYAKLTGLGLRLHYDSSALEMGDYFDRLIEGAQEFHIRDDTNDFDNDAKTDKYFLTAWADTSGDGWPSLDSDNFSLAGDWMLSPEAGALGVGPSPGDISWWSNNSGDVTTRHCLFDDIFRFGSDGSFANVMGDQTWMETWQHGPFTREGCGAPLAPHDGSNNATFVFDSAAGTITINGTGAHLGIPKVVNEGELDEGIAVPDSIVYEVVSSTPTSMTIQIGYGGGYWTFKLVKVADTSSVTLYSVPLTAILDFDTSTLKFTASSTAGGYELAASDVTVATSKGPIISVPDDITVAAVDSQGVSSNTKLIEDYLNSVKAEDVIDGSVLVTNNAPTTLPLGSTIITFSATDYSGNIGTATGLIIVEDQTPPVVQAPTPITISLINDNGVPASDSRITNFLLAATASDNVDTNLTITNDVPNLLPLGETTITFTATDTANLNGSSISRITVVTDSIKPVINLIGEAIVITDVDGEYNDQGAKAIDNIDGDISSRIVVNNSVDESRIGSYSVIYNVSDLSGNSADSVSRIVNVVSNDTDSDGVINSLDNCVSIPNSDQLDTDSDQIGNVCDSDDDGDGINDLADAFPLDRLEALDADADGIGNNADNCILTVNRDQLDTDADGLGNKCDLDDDGDGVNDDQDIFPLDSSENLDTDNDGIGNNADDDNDNDGVNDVEDAFPLNPSESIDTDSDGTGNNADLDDDGDRILDDMDAFPLDPSESVDTDNDGIGNNADDDDDNDGVNDVEDAFPLNPSESIDTDSDGTGNNADLDDDGDGVPDEQDEFPLLNTESEDSNNNGIGDNYEDRAALVASDILTQKMISYAGSVATLFVQDIEDEYADESDSWTLARGESVSLSIACSNGGGYDAVLTRSDWKVLTITLDVENCVDPNFMTTNGSATLTYDDALWDQPTPREKHPFEFSFADLRIMDSVNKSFTYTGSLYCDSHYNSVAESWTFTDEEDSLVYEGRWGSVFDDAGSVDWNVNSSLVADESGNTDFYIARYVTNCDFNNVGVIEGGKNHTILDVQYISEYNGPGYRISEDTRAEKLTKVQNKEIFYREKYTPETGWISEIDSRYGTNPSVRISGKGNYVVNVYSSIIPTYYWARRENVGNIISQEVDQWSETEWVYLNETTDQITANNYQLDYYSGWDMTNDGAVEVISEPWVMSRFYSESQCNRLLKFDEWTIVTQGTRSNSSNPCYFNTGFDVYAGDIWYQDENLDGINELFTLDDDQDGVQDAEDVFPSDPSESADSDGDGVGDNSDAFPQDASETLDSDGDGVGDNRDIFPFDRFESIDSDGDGIGNNADNDDDNDGVLDSLDEFPFNSDESIDSDGDGIGNNADSDDDNDGVNDESDAFPLDASESIDTDRDGLGNNADLDDDGDLVSDELELANGTNPLLADSDYDGVSDYHDVFPLNSYESIDTDGDGQGNNLDLDDDNDGIEDAIDVFPLDSNEWSDSDNDGVGDNADAFPNDPTEISDADSDGVGDNSDAFPNDSSETVDSDNDGTGDNADAFPNNALYKADSDSDGMPDAWEIRYGLDPNDASDATSDQDNDGVTALDEFLAGTIPSGSLDIDGNENYDALTDGLLLLRGMFGLDGSALVTGTIASDATYTESVDIESRIEILGDLADIDGNGDIDALTDGLLTLRYLFGLQGDALINGVVAVDATRTTAEEIEAHLKTLMPAL